MPVCPPGRIWNIRAKVTKSTSDLNCVSLSMALQHGSSPGATAIAPNPIYFSGKGLFNKAQTGRSRGRQSPNLATFLWQSQEVNSPLIYSSPLLNTLDSL